MDKRQRGSILTSGLNNRGLLSTFAAHTAGDWPAATAKRCQKQHKTWPDNADYQAIKALIMAPAQRRQILLENPSMAQNAVIALPRERYTRVDFTALRARLHKIATRRIIALYYSEEALEAIGCSSPEGLERRLDGLRDHLVQRVVLKNPALAAHLANARSFNSWPSAVVDFLLSAAEQNLSQATLADHLAVWLKPRVASVLKGEGLATLADLKRCIESRGTGWYRPIPRLGPKRAQAIENWLRSQPGLGPLNLALDAPVDGLVELASNSSLTPLERIGRITAALSGVEGRNRSAQFCLVSARCDLDAVNAYLYKFRGQPSTLLAYRKEIERFLLWCVVERRTALSSVLTDECEAYKDFLAQLPAHWRGAWAPRHASRWKPFAGQLAASSQRYAVQVLRSCFEWLARVRYLGGNPWVTVADPAVAQPELPIDIERALPLALWGQLAAAGGLLDLVCGSAPPLNGENIGTKDPRAAAAQYRLARAAILLMGDSGLRREEVARASRNHLRQVPEQPELWELKVLGKRNKWRSVFLPQRVVAAIKAHWQDRGHDFGDDNSAMAVLSAVVPGCAPATVAKHWQPTPTGVRLTGAGLTPDTLYQVVIRAFKSMAADARLPLSESQRSALLRGAPHALRHTFGTQAAAKNMPLDVLQKLMGHASLQTTSIYVQAERGRSIEEVSKLFLDQSGTPP